MSRHRHDSARPSLGGALIAVVMGLGLLTFAAELVLRVAMPNWREYYSGWFMEMAAPVPGLPPFTVGKPGFDGWFSQNNGDFRAHIRINEFGLRNDEPVTAANGRLWVIGDSMAFGWGVQRDETYTQVIADRLGWPAFNVASPGTDICGYQGLLRRMPSGTGPSAVVVGLILENDMRVYDCAEEGKAPPPVTDNQDGPFSSLIHFKRFLTRHLALYNFFAVSLKRVDMVAHAMVRFGLVEPDHQFHVRIDATKLDEVVISTAKALGDLRSMVPAETPFVVLVAPARFEIRDDAPFFKAMREKMIAALAAEGVAAVDPIAEFKQAGFAPTHFMHDGHWSALGHRIAGETVTQWFRANTTLVAGQK
jgi:hypothetical protein